MSDSETSGLSRWSRRKAAQRIQKSRSRGPRITFADDALVGEDTELPLSEPAHALPAAADKESATVDAADTGAEPLIDDDQPLDDSPEALDNMAMEHDLPTLDSLGAESDFKPFMQSSIPDVLRQAAMRRLWRIDPAFGFLDGMNDYDENFRVIDKLITALDTSYKAGRGFLDGDDDADEEGESDMEAAATQPDSGTPVANAEEGPGQSDPEADDLDMDDDNDPNAEI